MKKEYNFEDFKKIIEVLRSEEGCPWDRAQTFSSMKSCLINECNEVIQAVDNNDIENLCEELGDVLLQVVMNAQIASESGLFDISDIIQGICEKLIRRHPHVFGENKRAMTPEEGLAQWEEIKRQEREKKS